MTGTTFSRDALVPELIAEWSALDDVLAAIPERGWALPTALPGWTVQDIVAHLIGTESILAGRPTPKDEQAKHLPHVRNEIAAVNEQWVQSLRPETPARVLDSFREIVEVRGRALERTTQRDFDAPSWTPVGEATYGRFMRIRLFDCWMHEQDIRDAVGMAGHEDGSCAEGALAEILAALGYVVGKRAGAAEGSTVTIELTGPVQVDVHVAVDGRASVVAELVGPPTVTLRLTSSLFVRLAGGRVAPTEHRDEIALDGDTALGERIVRNLAFTI